MLKNPKTEKVEKADVFKSGGRVVAVLFSDGTSIEDRKEIAKLNIKMDIEDIHRERIRNLEMPSREY